MKTAIIAFGAALVASATATNTVKFINRCPYDVFYWTVGPPGSNISGEDYEHTMVPKYDVAVLNMVNSETIGGGLSIKMRDLPHYRVAPAGIVQVEYNLQPSQNSLWYDLSAIDCEMSAGPENPARCPLVDGGIEIYVPGQRGRECKKASCMSNMCKNTYTEHGSWYNEPTHYCEAGADLVVETCTHNPGQQTHDDKVPHVESHPVPEPHPLVPVSVSKQTSRDGTCGSKTNYTCKGSRWGDCCSSYGFCGKSEKYCTAETCKPEYGVCPWVPSGPLNVSTDGTCGRENSFTCKGSKFGQCCSEYGYCGDTDKFCKASTCKEAFGICSGVLNSTSIASITASPSAKVEKPKSTAFEKPSITTVSKASRTADVWPKKIEGPGDTQATKSQPLPRDRIIPYPSAWIKCQQELYPNSYPFKGIDPVIIPRSRIFSLREMQKCIDKYNSVHRENQG